MEMLSPSAGEWDMYGPWESFDRIVHVDLMKMQEHMKAHHLQSSTFHLSAIAHRSDPLAEGDDPHGFRQADLFFDLRGVACRLRTSAVWFSQKKMKENKSGWCPKKEEQEGQ
jgi:hypothetical protein